ncbi:hypothetical protein [Bradyrhizobium sp. TM233]|uniref:hypothetical protein n=1 Tax=Bradyrhizobium sp. TM233 TaxID=2599801 RepID=UPI0030C77D91
MLRQTLKCALLAMAIFSSAALLLAMHRPRPAREDACVHLTPPSRNQIAMNIMSPSNLDNTGTPQSEASRHSSTAAAVQDQIEP